LRIGAADNFSLSNFNHTRSRKHLRLCLRLWPRRFGGSFLSCYFDVRARSNVFVLRPRRRDNRNRNLRGWWRLSFTGQLWCRRWRRGRWRDRLSRRLFAGVGRSHIDVFHYLAGFAIRDPAEPRRNVDLCVEAMPGGLFNGDCSHLPGLLVDFGITGYDEVRLIFRVGSVRRGSAAAGPGHIDVQQAED
jgi:hypothetical protein